MPTIASTSILFWILVPTGVATILFAWRRDGWRSIPLLIFLVYSGLATSNASLYQKYYDSVALLVCVLIFFQQERYRRLSSQILLLIYSAIFALYAAAHV
jgi:hypothetical protein